ncbi:sugar phosphate isomerase/epimerase family protein [Candidatus Bipolaricaulota bacterium]
MMTGIGLNGATLPERDLLTKIRAAGDAGFDFYEPRVPELLAFDTPEGRDEAAQAMTDSGLKWLPLNGLEGVFSSVDGGAKVAAEEVFSLAARFGVSQVIVVPAPPDEGLTPQGAIEDLLRFREDAARHDVRLLYELIGFTHHAFPTLALASEIAGGAGLPLVLDTFHLAVSETGTEAIESLAADQIGLVHLTDAILDGRSPMVITDGDRVLPDEGELALEEIMEAIGRTGFRGPISVEVFHPKYADEETNLVSERAIREARRLIETWR